MQYAWLVLLLSWKALLPCCLGRRTHSSLGGGPRALALYNTHHPATGVAKVPCFATWHITEGGFSCPAGRIDRWRSSRMVDAAQEKRIAYTVTEHYYGLGTRLYATGKAEGTKRKLFSSRKKKKARQQRQERKMTSSKLSLNQTGSIIESTPKAKVQPKAKANDESVSAVFVASEGKTQMPSGTDQDEQDLEPRKRQTQMPKQSADSTKPEQKDVKPDNDNLEPGSEKDATISNRQMHFLENLFSDQNTLNTRQIVSMLYHLLGSENREIVSIFEDLIGQAPEQEPVTEEGAECPDGKASPGDAETTSQEEISNKLKNADKTNEVATADPEAAPEANNGAFIWPFEVMDDHDNTNEDTANEKKQQGHWADYLSEKSSLSKRDVRQLRHLQVLTKHENLKLLKKLDPRKNVSALFIPSANETEDGDSNKEASEAADKVSSRPDPMYGEAAGSESAMNADGAAEPSEPELLLTASKLETYPKLQDSGIAQKLKLYEAAGPAKNQRFDSFIVSIPKLQRQMSKKRELHQVKSLEFEIPVTMFSLSHGFLATLYRRYLRPSLVKSLEETFRVKLEHPCGLMDFESLDLRAMATVNPMEKQIDRELLSRYLRNVVVQSRLDEGERDIIEFEGTSAEMPKKLRKKIAELFKWIKDQVFLNACINILSSLLGRSPSMAELGFALGQSDPQKLEIALAICDSYTKLLFDGLSTPVGELAILRLEKDWNIERHDYEGKITIMDPHMYNVQGTVDSVLWRRMCSIHLNTLSSLGSKALSQIYGFALSAAKTDVLKAYLPEHMPIGKYRLARRAMTIKNKLSLIQGKMIKQVRASRESGIRVPEELYKDDPFAKRVVEVELSYPDAEPDTPESVLRDKAHEEAFNKEMEKRLEVPWDSIIDALEGLETREVGGRSTNIPRDMPSPYPRRLRYRPIHDYEDLEDEEDESDGGSQHPLVKVRDMLLRKSMRMLANEALDDRVARFLYMAKLGLFTDDSWNDQQLAEALGLSDLAIIDFIFYAAQAHCDLYEAWRIKLKLPPYVDETSMCPMLVAKLRFEPNRVPHHIKTLLEKRDQLLGSKTRIHRAPRPNAFPVSPSMKNRYKRLRSIKPRMGTMKDSLMEYRERPQAIEKTLELSPINYLVDAFDMQYDWLML